MNSKKPRYIIEEEELGISFQDEGPWRSWHLSTYGDSIASLIWNADISEIDQDGGSIDFYPLEDAEPDILAAAEQIILKKILS